MTLSKSDAKTLLNSLIFTGDRPDDWIQDVWSLSPTLGQSAASLVDVFEMLVDSLSEEQLHIFVEQIYLRHRPMLEELDILDQWQKHFH